MKIESSGIPPIVPKKQAIKSSDAKSGESQRATNKSTSSTKQKISRWFTQVGLSPNAEYVDYKARSVAAKRHQDIRIVKRAENLQKIMQLAFQVAVSDSLDEEIDADWFYAFIDLAEHIYAPVMQELWSKILAVEISRPGSFSLRSLETLKTLTQRDAQVFAVACNLASRKTGDPIPRLITHYNQRRSLSCLLFGKAKRPINIGNYGLSYPSLLSLIDLGLLMPAEIESAEVTVKQSIQLRCGETSLELKPKRSGLALVYYKFSNVGAELFMLSRKKQNQEYIDALKRTLAAGFNIK